MMKLDKKQIIKLLKGAPYLENCLSCDRGIQKYALKLVNQLTTEYYFACENATEIETTLKELRKTLLNCANSLREYIYDADIANALCLPFEFSRTNGGKKSPNTYETWLDFQA